METSILVQDNWIKELLLEINQFKVGEVVLYSKFNIKSKLIEKGFDASYAEKFQNFLNNQGLITLDIRKGRYGTRFSLNKLIEYSDVSDWRTKSVSGKPKNTQKVSLPKVKESVQKRTSQIVSISPKEYKLGQVVYYLDNNRLKEGKIIQMELAKGSTAKVIDDLKNSDIEYTVLDKSGSKFYFEVFEISDSIEGLFSILKSIFINENKIKS